VSKKILVVDDELNIREVTQMSLEMIGGFEVIQAASGAEALQVAALERPDAILLDVMMPDMDGPTTFVKLQGDPACADIPVVLLTAKIQPSDRARFEGLGVAGLISKPFDPMTLPHEIERVLGW
jgi:CheY-like chemotaxis protein